MSNFRFEQLLTASGLPEGERRDLSTIFSTLPQKRQADLIDGWESSVLPKLLEAKAILEEQRNEILAQSVRQLREVRDQFAMARRQFQAAAGARAAEVAQGAAASDAARAAQGRADQMAKIRALAAGPAIPSAAAEPDPLAALSSDAPTGTGPYAPVPVGDPLNNLV